MLDPLTAFGIGSLIYTALHFIPSRKPTQDDLILSTWNNMGITNKDGLLPVKKDGVWFLPAGLSPKDIERTIPALSYQLEQNIEMELKGKAIILHNYPPLPNHIPYRQQDLSKYKLGLVMGKTNKKECLVLDCNDTTPFYLMAGLRGMGKSNAIKLIIRQWQEYGYEPDYLNYFLIDLKLGVELGQYADSPLCKGTCYDPDTQQLDAMLGYLRRELRRRMKLFFDKGVFKIDEYNSIPGVERLPYLMVIIDEYAELQRDKEIESKLLSLLQTGRAAGIRCILSTQRPTHDLVNSSIKAQFDTRLCFSVADRTNSEVILDVGGAEKLEGIPGRAILLHNRLEPVQIMVAS